MKHLLRLVALSVLFLAFLAPQFANVALAHGHVEVGDYEIVIGFHNEPAFQSEVNGVEFFVTNTTTEEPVNGLEETLKLEIVYGASKRELPVKAQWGQEGAYIGYVIPVEAGDYTVHIWGDIEGTPVDVEMTSSPDTFSAVGAKSEIAFPQADPTAGELEAQVDSAVQAAQTASQAAQSAAQSAQTALIVGIVGAVLGVVGIVVGMMGIRAKKA
jgi:hypothetical protein